MPTSSGKGWDELGETKALKVIVLIHFHCKGFCTVSFHVSLNAQDA